MGFRFGKNFRAIAWLITTTFGEVSESAAEVTEPAE